MEKALLEVRGLTKSYKNGSTHVDAVRDVSFNVRQGESFGIVGESGSGKSTVLRQICGMEKPDSGSIRFDGEEVTTLKGGELRGLYSRLQIVFQTPAASFDPRMTVRKALYEPLVKLCKIRDKAQLDARAIELFEQVGLCPDLLDRYAFELSGGQCQRAAVARAIAVKPKLLLCDEVTSALDVSAQANLAALLCELCGSLDMSMIFVSHNIALVSNICQGCIVMHRGAAEECGGIREIISSPKSDCTKRLIASAAL